MISNVTGDHGRLSIIFLSDIGYRADTLKGQGPSARSLGEEAKNAE